MDTSWNAGFSPFGYYPNNLFNSYSNQVWMNDMTGMDWNSPMGFSMNDSVFNSNPYMTPFTGGYMGGANMEQYYRNNERYQDYMLDSQVRLQKRAREADITLNATQESIRQKAIVLNEKIVQNEQSQILSSFNSLVSSLRSYYGTNSNEEELKNKALALYEQQFGETLQASLRKNGSNSFTHGIKEITLAPFADFTSTEQNIARINGQPEGRTESRKRQAGNAAGGALLAAIGKTIYTLASKKASFGFKGSAATIAIGAAAGWIAGKFLNDKA